MKKAAMAGALGFGLLIALLLSMFLIIASDEDSGGSGSGLYISVNLSAEVLAHQPMVEKYAQQNGISDYVYVLLAIIQVESEGKLEDVMQSSESAGLPVNTLGTEDSIKQGCKYFAELVAKADRLSCDMDAIIQAYNYGSGFLDFVAKNGKRYTFELAQEFSRQRSGGVKVIYKNAISTPINGGWRYNYGNMFYVRLVSEYLYAAQFDNETVNAIMNEALKYQGWEYVYGGASPTTSFDCSGLTQWCYGVAGITLPRTAQAQYDVTRHIPFGDAQPGDLVFFQGTYNCGDYITHVGIYVGDNRMYHAGNPIGFADLTSAYWQAHLVCAGRVGQ